MIIEGLFSFLGGSAFRMIWGEVSSWLNKRQEHKFEIERMHMQAEHDAAQHTRTMQSLEFQAAQQVKVIEVQGKTAMDVTEMNAFLETVKITGRKSGIKSVDAWNAAIRPGLATWGVIMLSGDALKWLTVSDGTMGVVYAILGVYVADRSLTHRGK